MVFFTEKYAEIVFDESSSIIKVTFKAYMDSTQLRGVYEQISSCAGKYRASKVLADARTYVTLRPEDQEWMAKVWMPKAIAAGIRKIARLLPENMIQKQVAGKMIQQVSDNIVSQNFASPEEGLRWLKSN